MTIQGFWKYLADLVARVLHPNLKDAVERLAFVFAESVKRSFDRSRSPDGTPFAPVLRGGKPLLLTHVLYQWAYYSATQVKYGRDGFLVEQETPFYARFHQLGTARIKARPFFGLDAQAEEQAADIVGDTAINFVVGQPGK